MGVNVLFLQTLQNGTVSRNLTSYGTRDLALIALYGGMRASIGDANVIKCVGEIITDDGAVIKCERWEASEAVSAEE